MSITFACPCGKLLKARNEYAGRRTRCPRCGALLIIPHASDDVGSISCSELLAPSDFADVELVVKAATTVSPPLTLDILEPAPLDLTTGEPEPIWSSQPDTNGVEAVPEIRPEPIVSARSSGRREPWFFAFLEYDAFVCMALGAIQFVVVVIALASGSSLDRPRTFLASLIVLLAALGFGGLILLALDAARSLRSLR